MNITVAPISPAATSPAKAPQQGNHFATDAVYKGYDLMVRKFATHIIREPMVTSTTRADLVRAISSPAVTFAASAADGSILITCPGSLPDSLTVLAEALDHGPSPTAATDKLAEMLQNLDRKIDGVVQDQQGFERLSDRLEAIEFSLRERLDPEVEAARTRVTEAAFGQIGHRLEMVLDRIAQIPEPLPFDTMPLELMLAASETRLMTAIHAPATPTDLSPVIDAVHRISHQITTIPEADQALTRVEAKLDQLATRPAPIPDLSPHHKALSAAGASLAALTQRLDQTVDRLPDPQTLADQHKSLGILAARLAETPAEVERLLAPRLTFAGIEADLKVLKEAVSPTTLAAPVTEGLSYLAAQLTALAARPHPVLDLTAQNSTLSDVAATMADLDRRMADLTRITTAGPDLGLLSAQYQTVLSVLGQPAQSAEVAAALMQITELAARPAPVLDLAGPVASLAKITLTLDDLTQDLGGLRQIVVAGPDLSEPVQALTRITTRLDGLTQDLGGLRQIVETGPDLSAPVVALSKIAATLDGLTQDLGGLRQTIETGPDLSAPVNALAHVTTLLSDVAQGIETLTELTTTGPDLSTLTRQYDALMAALGNPAQTDQMARNLADLAHQITDLATRPAPVLDLSAPVTALARITTQLDEVAQGIDHLSQRTAGPDLSTFTAQMDQLRTTLGQPAQGDVVEAQLADMADRISALANLPAAIELLTDPVQALAQIATAQTGLSNQLDRLAETMVTSPELAQQFDAVLMTLGQPAQGSAMAGALAHLGAQITTLTERPEPRPDVTVQDLTQLVAPFSDRLDSILGTLTSAPDLSVMTTGFDMVLAAIGRPVQAEAEARTAGQIADLAQQITGLTEAVASGAGLAPLFDRIDQLGQPAQHDPLAAALTSLSEHLSVLSERPDPVIDMTAQRQSFARFGTALVNAVERLEHVAETMSTGPDLTPLQTQLAALQHDLATPDTDLRHALTDLAAQIAALTDRADPSPILHQQGQALTAALAQVAQGIDSLLQGFTDSPDITAMLMQLEHGLSRAVQTHGSDQLAAPLAELATQIAELAQRPDPVLDLSSHQQDFAGFAAHLATAVQRLETVADVVTEQVTAGPDQSHILSRIDTLRADVAGLAQDTTLPDHLTHISAQIASLLDRPDTAPDMAEQKQNIADFAKGLADLVHWLEPLTRDLAAGPDFSAILAEFALLRAEMDLPARDRALDQAFADLSLQIADLAKSPDGLVSLAEQRRSFASFSNALAFMLQRLDSLGAVIPPQPDTTPSEDGEDGQHLTGQIALMSRSPVPGPHLPLKGLTDTLSTLILRLEYLVGTLSAPPTEQAEPVIQPARDPAQLIEDLATATQALAQIITILESDQDRTGLPPAQAASVAQLFDRLDTALQAYDVGGQLPGPALAEAISTLSGALNGTRDALLPGQEVPFLHRLRLDFAEFVARTLQVQTERN